MKDLNEIMDAEIMAAFKNEISRDGGEITLEEYKRLKRYWKQAAGTTAEIIAKHIGQKLKAGAPA